jgi:hypothetical protein
LVIKILQRRRVYQAPSLANDLSLLLPQKCDMDMPMTRRQALLGFCQFLAASPLLRADKKYSELTDLLKQVNVFDLGAATLERRPSPHKCNRLGPIGLSSAIA